MWNSNPRNQRPLPVGLLIRLSRQEGSRTPECETKPNVQEAHKDIYPEGKVLSDANRRWGAEVDQVGENAWD